MFFSVRVMLCFYISFNLFMLYFYFNATTPTKIYTLSLHDALPISHKDVAQVRYELPINTPVINTSTPPKPTCSAAETRSEEHTSELQSRQYLVCRLLLEKKKNKKNIIYLIYINS